MSRSNVSFRSISAEGHARTQQQTHLSAEIVHDSIDVKNVQLKILKTLKNVKKRDKNKKTVCKRNKKVTYS